MRYTEKDRKFFLQPAEVVAPQLLGKLLCRRIDGEKILKIRICEVEAYGAEDTANYGYGYEGNGGEKRKRKLMRRYLSRAVPVVYTEECS